MDEHLVWYEGSGLSDRRWFHQDERGSVVAVSDGSGVLLGSWRYGPYGEGEAVVATSADVFFVVGLGLNVGVFRNEETGRMGLFGSVEFGIGLDASVGVNFGRASSAGALNGFSVFLSGSYRVVEGQVSFALDGFGELGGVPKTGGYALGMPAGLSAGGSFGFVTCPFADQVPMCR